MSAKPARVPGICVLMILGLMLGGCPPALEPIGPDGPFPEPAIDFARAAELMSAARDVTQNWRLSGDDLRAMYTSDTVEAFVFATVLPGDDGESRFLLLTDHALMRQTLVLGGTNTYRQWQVDALTEPDYQEDLGANVHTGWNDLAVAVLNIALPELRTDHELTVTGFSLGGALAAITSAYLDLMGYPVVETVTFGQPRVTDVDGIAAFASVPITRFANDGDPFPRMKADGSPAAHFGRLVVLYDGPNYAYVPAGDPLLEADTHPFDAFTSDDFSYHSEDLYLERVSAKITEASQVVYAP